MSNQMLSEANFDGYLTRVNDAWEECLGYTQEEMMSRPYFDLVHPDDQQPTLDVASALAQKDFSVVSFRNRFRAKDGSWRWLSWSARSDSERIYAAATDVTELKTSESEREWLLTKISTLAHTDELTSLPTDAHGTKRSVGSCCGASVSAWTSRWRWSTSTTSSPSMTHTVIPPAIGSFAERLRGGAGLYAHRISLLGPAARSLQCCSPGVDLARPML